MKAFEKNTFETHDTLRVEGQDYTFISLPKAEKALGDLSRLPFSLKILLENLLRFEDGSSAHSALLRQWIQNYPSLPSQEISFSPARVLMQDFTGVPAIVDLAALRDALHARGKNPQKVNPRVPVDLVIDHSVIVDSYGVPDSFQKNVQKEYERNRERYRFLHWGQKAFQNFRVVPPGTGICHQVNLEYLGQVVWHEEIQGKNYAYPDTLVGTDSHTTMINGLGVLGWGVGGIEAEAAMLGQPISMMIPPVVGFKLTGNLKEGATATDLVLTITEMLRQKGVVDKFVEFYGEGLKELSLPDRATISNMCPEYGATCAYFPIDEETLAYLKFTGRDLHRIALVEAYAKEQGLWRCSSTEPLFSETLELDLRRVEPCLAGPKRPQDKILLSKAASECQAFLAKEPGVSAEISPSKGNKFTLSQGDIVIAAITSCTNTSNPSVMLGAGLLAQKALKHGLHVKPWVKTSLAPGSQVVTDYLEKSGLDQSLNALGFRLVGYGCTTCIGNSGPLDPEIAQAIDHQKLSVAAVLSGNRNFEGRIHPQVKLNYLASPLLVVAYALAGSMKIDLMKEPLGTDPTTGNPVYLKDIWPSQQEIQEAIRAHLTPKMFQQRYGEVFKGDKAWEALSQGSSVLYSWDAKSTYVKRPPYFEDLSPEPAHSTPNLMNARILAILGDSITTDHISPAGSIKPQAPAGLYLTNHGISKEDFNSYGSRRGNHEVMMRGTFGNVRLINEMVPENPGGFTRYIPEGSILPIYEAAMRYQEQKTPLVVIAGKDYGSGSSRDWAAKGPLLLGVKALIAESFERIHRSNLIGMGVLPLQFTEGQTRKTLELQGDEILSITGFDQGLKPRLRVQCLITSRDGRPSRTCALICRIDTETERDYFLHGGILPYVLRSLENAA